MVDRRRFVAIGLWLTVSVAVASAVATIAVVTGLVEWRSEGDPAPNVHNRNHLAQGPQPVDVNGESSLIQITTRKTGRPIRLYVWERDGKRCRVLVSPGGTGTSCGGRRPLPTEVGVHPNQIGAAPDGMLLLWGEAGSEVSRLELHFEDGRTEPLPLVKQFALYQVDPADFAPGRRPVRLIGRNESGKAIGEQRVNVLK